MSSIIKFIFNLTLSVLLCVHLAGCSKKTTTQLRDITPENELYEASISKLERGKYDSALTSIEDLELYYPGSDSLSEVLYLKANALYSLGRYEESNYVVETFLLRFPHTEQAEDMLFLKSLNYYQRVIDIGRDQHMTRMAYESLEKFLQIYPSSKYSTEAKLKLEYLEAALAGKEMDIGYFYYNKKNYAAALRRFQNVIDDFSTTIFTPEALYRTSEIFLILRMPNEARTYAAILGKNYPESQWYHDIYQSFEDL